MCGRGGFRGGYSEVVISIIVNIRTIKRAPFLGYPNVIICQLRWEWLPHREYGAIFIIDAALTENANVIVFNMRGNIHIDWVRNDSCSRRYFRLRH